MKLANWKGSAPDSKKIPGVLGMQSGINSVPMAVGVMEKALYSSYTPELFSTLSDDINLESFSS